MTQSIKTEKESQKPIATISVPLGKRKAAGRKVE